MSPTQHEAHPLAHQILALYREDRRTAPMLEIAGGSGRNTRFLTEAGIPVVSTRDDEAYTQLPGGSRHYGAALSTHGYLHGTVAKLRIGLAEVRRVLAPDAPFLFTLGSIKDARFGLGIPFDDHTFAPGDGDEAGIPHAYFDRDGVVELVRAGFTLVTLEERPVDEIVGAWAHEAPHGMWHWFVVARRT